MTNKKTTMKNKSTI